MHHCGFNTRRPFAGTHYTPGCMKRVQQLAQYIAVSRPWIESRLLNPEFSTLIITPPLPPMPFRKVTLYNSWTGPTISTKIVKISNLYCKNFLIFLSPHSFSRYWPDLKTSWHDGMCWRFKQELNRLLGLDWSSGFKLLKYRTLCNVALFSSMSLLFKSTVTTN